MPHKVLRHHVEQIPVTGGLQPRQIQQAWHFFQGDNTGVSGVAMAVSRLHICNYPLLAARGVGGMSALEVMGGHSMRYSHGVGHCGHDGAVPRGPVAPKRPYLDSLCMLDTMASQKSTRLFGSATLRRCSVGMVKMANSPTSSPQGEIDALQLVCHSCTAVSPKTNIGAATPPLTLRVTGEWASTAVLEVGFGTLM